MKGYIRTGLKYAVPIVAIASIALRRRKLRTSEIDVSIDLSSTRPQPVQTNLEVNKDYLDRFRYAGAF